MNYDPGEEIQLEVESKIKFFANAKTWREQKTYVRAVDELKELKTDDEQTDAALELVCANVTRTEPVIEITPESIAGVLDFRQIWGLVAAIKYNMTHEQKKTVD